MSSKRIKKAQVANFRSVDASREKIVAALEETLRDVRAGKVDTITLVTVNKENATVLGRITGWMPDGPDVFDKIAEITETVLMEAAKRVFGDASGAPPANEMN